MSKERSLPDPQLDTDAEQIPTQDLGRRAISGMGWRSGSIAIQALGQVAYTAIMARLISPEAFGLVAMTVVARGIGTLLSRMGIGQALIQKPTLTEKDVRAGVTLSIAFGLIFFGVFWLLAPALASVFSEPRAVPVIRGAALIFVALGMQSTPDNLLRRELRFKESAFIHTTGFFVGYLLIGVGAATAGAGVWALIAAPIAHSLFDTVFYYSRVRHPIMPTLDMGVYRGLLSYGTRISLIQGLDFFGSQTDTIVVGRFAGVDLLGVYNRAFYLAVLPVQMVMSTMHYVLFASFSHIQADLPRLTRVYLNSAKVSAALFFPVAAGIGSFGNELILVLLGERYREATVLIPFFSLYVAMSKVSSLSGVLCEVRAELNKRMALQAGYLALLICALLAVAGGPLWRYGAVLAGGEIVRNIAYNVLIIRRIIPASLRQLFSVYVPALQAAVLVVVAVLTTRTALVGALGAHPIVALMAEGGTMVLVFLFMVRRGSLQFVRTELLSRIKEDASPSGFKRILEVALRVLFGPNARTRT